MYATYTFYTETYLGSALTEQEFARAATRADAFINYYTMGKAKDTRIRTTRLQCAAVRWRNSIKLLRTLKRRA